MSTRANIIIKDSYDKLWFYRHSDGYPEGALPTLKEFMRKVAKGDIRDNAMQSCGWLVIIGHEEYKAHQPDWKVGAYEPTTGQHGDIEYLYTIDLDKKVIIVDDLSGGVEEINDFSA
jgi:hypothetical protein